MSQFSLWETKPKIAFLDEKFAFAFSWYHHIVASYSGEARGEDLCSDDTVSYTTTKHLWISDEWNHIELDHKKQAQTERDFHVRGCCCLVHHPNSASCCGLTIQYLHIAATSAKVQKKSSDRNDLRSTVRRRSCLHEIRGSGNRLSEAKRHCVQCSVAK